jgi:hypothetical protein
MIHFGFLEKSPSFISADTMVSAVFKKSTRRVVSLIDGRKLRTQRIETIMFPVKGHGHHTAVMVREKGISFLIIGAWLKDFPKQNGRLGKSVEIARPSGLLPCTTIFA